MTRHVRDAEFWGLPVGTPIKPGMKPQGGTAGKPSKPSTGGDSSTSTGVTLRRRIKPTRVSTSKKPASDAAPKDAPETPGDEPDTTVRDNKDFSVKSAAEELKKIKKDGREDGAGTVTDPIDCGDNIKKAHQLLAEGKHVRLNSPEEVSLLIDELAKEAAFAKETGTAIPDYDLCQVTVPGTNLFCTDESVEMMTAKGWKRYDDLRVGEPVLTIDHITGLSHWEPLLAVNVFPAEKRTMLSIEGSLHSSLTTLDHRWAVLTDKRKAGQQRNWRTSETLKWDDKIPLSAPCVTLPTEPKYTDGLVALVAWAWTEGTVQAGRLRIYQSATVNPTHVARIRATLTSTFGSARVPSQNGGRSDDEQTPGWYETTNGETGMVSFHLNKAASEGVVCHMDSQKVVRPEFLTALTEGQLRVFVDVSLMADGHATTAGYRSLCQRVEGRVRAFEQACVLLGIPTHTTTVPDTRPHHQGKSMYNVSLMARDVVKPYNLRMQRVEYDGMVWCPTTPNGTWLARRNGSVYVTGNCLETKGIPRAEMPQFSGQPMPGSYAQAKADADPKGEADVTDEFGDLLATLGIDVEETDMPVDHLKATQSQLVGTKVAGMRAAMRKGLIKDAPIYVTRDGYIVDGHHRWAAKMALDLEDGKLGDVDMPVKKIDADIGYILDLSNGFTEMAGIKPKGTGANAEGVKILARLSRLAGNLPHHACEGGACDVKSGLYDAYLTTVEDLLEGVSE